MAILFHAGKNKQAASICINPIFDKRSLLDFIHQRLREARDKDALRSLVQPRGLLDFVSNDYLGIVTNKRINLPDARSYDTGSAGSRLLAGNYGLIEEAEQQIAEFHHAAAGLIFNSGYDANLGLFSCIGRPGTIILYDRLIHASVHDGMRLGRAAGHAFAHNDLNDLERKLKQLPRPVFVVTESVFSMDGDMAPLEDISKLCVKYAAALIVDEAHATGVIGSRGEGLVQMLGLQDQCFARIHTFGKALGCHGAVILGSAELRKYLVNFSRPFLYSTALPEHSIALVLQAYSLFPEMKKEREHLAELISMFRQAVLPVERTAGTTAIQGIIIPGNTQVRKVAAELQGLGFDIRPVISPTVPRGSERLRVVLHAFNDKESVQRLLKHLENTEELIEREQ